MPGRPTIIYCAANAGQAHVLRMMLEECGITAWVEGQAGQESAHDWSSMPQVMVGEQDAQDARIIAAAFDERTRHGSASDSNSPYELVPEVWSAWPICPQCGERRAARCPVCSLSGTDFPLADIQDVADGERVLLVCSACDDHFLPEWNRRCHRCGHDYGDGWEAAAPVEIVRVGLNPRAIAVAAVMLTGVLALGAYFYVLFSSRAG